MRASPDHLGVFASRLRRRLLLVRTAEGAGLGLLAAAAIGLVLVPILLYRDQPALRLAVGLLAVGAAAGALAAILRRPDPLTALTHADRQLKLHDLLSTAWAIQRGGQCDSAFAGAVLWAAQSQAVRVPPRSITLHRLGRRAWGGIGIAAALVLALGLISASPLDTQASAEPTAFSRSAATRARDSSANRNGGGSASGASIAPAADVGGHDDRWLDINPNTQTLAVHDPANSTNSASGTDPNGAGAGYARSFSSIIAEWFGIGSAGRNARNGDNAGDQNASGAGTASETAAVPPPPWTSAAWPSARDAATSAIRDGQIPAAYHDLIRDYFDRR